MITTDGLKDLFNQKLQDTGSLDAAFTKAVWAAYLQGFEDGNKSFTCNQENLDGTGSS